MSGEHLSASTRALLKGARADAPSAAARAKVWSGVSATLGGAAGASIAGAGGSGLGTSGAGLGAAKMLAAGTLLGGVITVGLAAMLLRIGPAPSPSRMPPASMAAVAAARAVAAPDTPAPDSRRDDLLGSPPAGANALPGTVPGAQVPSAATHGTSLPSASHAATPRHTTPSHGPRPAAAAPPARHASGDDALTREASLVASARAALSGGNAEEALRLVRSARSMPSPQLVPEELTVEAQALRALGKADDARGVDATLRSQYPDSALAR